MQMPIFTPDRQDEILAFFKANNYAVISGTLSPEELRFLNDFMDRSQREVPAEWGIDKGAMPSHGQILMNYPELDRFVRPPTTYPLVEAILGEGVRFGQFDFREVPREMSANCPMAFHQDRAGVQPQNPDPSCESAYVCTIHYLEDVHECCPCFCVVPNSHPYASLEEARQKMGDDYHEIPIRAQAGSTILYNINIFHTRLSGREGCNHGRRTQHTYFSHESSPPLTNWVLIPRRLARHPDPDVRAFYSQWTPAMVEYAREHFS